MVQLEASTIVHHKPHHCVTCFDLLSGHSSHLLICGDFNYNDINWSDLSTPKLNATKMDTIQDFSVPPSPCKSTTPHTLDLSCVGIICWIKCATYLGLEIVIMYVSASILHPTQCFVCHNHHFNLNQANFPGMQDCQVGYLLMGC